MTTRHVAHVDSGEGNSTDEGKLTLPKSGRIRGESRAQKSPFEMMPHLMSWVVGSACFSQVATVLAMITLAFKQIGGYYPYVVLVVVGLCCYILSLTFFGRNGMVQLFGTKAETH